LMHWIVPIDGLAPGHRHERYEETILVLEGVLDLEIGGEHLTAEPGMWLRAPAGVRHAYANRGAAAARMLVTFTPGGIEDLFEEFADPVGSVEGRPSKLGRSPMEYVEKARLVHDTEYDL